MPMHRSPFRKRSAELPDWRTDVPGEFSDGLGLTISAASAAVHPVCVSSGTVQLDERLQVSRHAAAVRDPVPGHHARRQTLERQLRLGTQDYFGHAWRRWWEQGLDTADCSDGTAG